MKRHAVRHRRTSPSTIDANGDIPAQLMRQCRDEGAVATLWFRPRADRRVDAWVADRVTGKAVLRTYEQPDSGAERARLALRAVELLHASLLEVRLMPAAEQNEFPEVKRFATREREQPHWSFGTGVGAVFTPGLRPQPLLELQLGYAFRPDLSVEAQVISSVFPTRVDDERQRYGADVGVALLRAMAEWTPLRGRSVSAGVAAGTGVVLLWASGDSKLTGVETHTEAQVTWLIGGGFIASARLSEGVRLQVLGNIGVTVPEIGVALAGTVVAWIGRPIIDALVRLEFE